jgi:hypothetical protein
MVNNYYDLMTFGLGNQKFQDFVDKFQLKYNTPQTDGFAWDSEIQLDYTYEQLIASLGITTLPVYVDADSEGLDKSLGEFKIGSNKIPTQKHRYAMNAKMLRERMLMVQRFGDLIRGRRSTPSRMQDAFITPTLNATPGDLSLVLPKRILDGIIEMIYALDKVAPGTANDDTLLYGVEVKFYNMEVEVDEHLQTRYPGLYIIGDGSGITHSLSHASASGVHVARTISAK